MTKHYDAEAVKTCIFIIFVLVIVATIFCFIMDASNKSTELYNKRQIQFLNLCNLKGYPHLKSFDYLKTMKDTTFYKVTCSKMFEDGMTQEQTFVWEGIQ
jgi:hypothetical protein